MAHGGAHGLSGEFLNNARASSARLATKTSHENDRPIWTEEQNERLLRLVSNKTGISWKAVAAELGVEGNPAKVRSHWAALKSKRGGSWTKKEDSILAQAIQEHVGSGHAVGEWGTWVFAAEKLGFSRTPMECQTRWRNPLLPRQGKATAVTRFENIRGWRWHEDELSRLHNTIEWITQVRDSNRELDCVAQTEPWLVVNQASPKKQMGQFWVFVASQVGTRTSHQCHRKWDALSWGEKLGRMANVDAKRLAELVEKHGPRWNFLSQAYFPDQHPPHLQSLYRRWKAMGKKHNIDMLKFDPFARLQSFDGNTALRPTGKDGRYDPAGPLVRVYKSGPTSSLTPYVLALVNARFRFKSPGQLKAIKMPGTAKRLHIPPEILDTLLAAITHHKNDWISISRSTGLPISQCREYAEVLAKSLPQIKQMIHDADIEQLANRHMSAAKDTEEVGTRGHTNQE
ncbi:hypothetical protein GGF46_002764 [Coemansia sp. RSA 552]|nr:hypothetical protein GGF46_002764 [Coemansia sp. RSA 552]